MNHTVIDSRKLAKLKEFEIDLIISACGDNTFLKNKLETLKQLIKSL